MVWHPNAPQGRETDKVRFDAWMYIGGEGLDIGCGNCKVHPNAVGIDQIRIGGAPLGDMCADGRSLKQFTDESFDYVYSSHFLEHVIDYEATLAEWWRVVKVGGYLILYLPHRDYYPRMGQHGSNPDHKHDFHPDDIKKAMWRITKSGEVPSFDVVEDEDRVGGNEYSFFQVFRKCEVGEGRYDPWVTCRARLKTDGTRTVCISRYGAVGDTAFLASIAAQYKRNGWYVVVHTSPIGVDLLRHDDSIDELYSFNNDGVFFLGTLEPFWQHLARRYDRVINLTQSVEGQLLPSPEHVYHGYPLDVRQKLLSVSYMERMHDIAGVEHNWDGMRFAATIEEMHWAKGMQNTLSRREAPNGMQYRAPIIGVCLAGSACHKVYPFQHMAIARLMLEVDCSVILFGGPEDLPHEELVCQTALAMGIDPKRIARSCGKQWTLRKSLAVSVWCDLLLGPETGIQHHAARATESTTTGRGAYVVEVVPPHVWSSPLTPS
jgi:predicted SAM-dependent methyltransferase/ADP-heptose:LPS heptosyltransferase